MYVTQNRSDLLISSVVLLQSMLITNVFAEQSYGLSSMDLYAWYMSVDTVGAVGFYNSDLTSGNSNQDSIRDNLVYLCMCITLSGASQRHRHMQLVPLDEIFKLRSVGSLKGDITNVSRIISLRFFAQIINKYFCNSHSRLIPLSRQLGIVIHGVVCIHHCKRLSLYWKLA